MNIEQMTRYMIRTHIVDGYEYFVEDVGDIACFLSENIDTIFNRKTDFFYIGKNNEIPD